MRVVLALAFSACGRLLSSQSGGHARGQDLGATTMEDLVGQVVEGGFVDAPGVAVPGQWLTDSLKHFLFLPVQLPLGSFATDLKVMTDGKAMIVTLTEKVKEQPEDAAMKKFKLVLGAFKEEARGNSTELIKDLTEWQETEDNKEVKGLIATSLGSMTHIADVQKQGVPHAVNVPLSSLQVETQAVSDYVVPVADSNAYFQSGARSAAIKESFQITIPYPTEATSVFAVWVPGSNEVVLSMPLVQDDGDKVSHGAQPYIKVPIFDMKGDKVTGLGAKAADLTPEESAKEEVEKEVPHKKAVEETFHEDLQPIAPTKVLRG